MVRDKIHSCLSSAKEQCLKGSGGPSAPGSIYYRMTLSTAGGKKTGVAAARVKARHHYLYSVVGGWALGEGSMGTRTVLKTQRIKQERKILGAKKTSTLTTVFSLSSQR